jgi:proteasome lid subunit RPN8/RPN11
MPSSAPIEISRLLVNQVLHCAQEQSTREVCGLIGALHGRPTSVYAIQNVADLPETRFRLDPQQQIAAMRTMRERGEDLYAIFHSHPSAPAEPSSLDIDEAAYPEALYFIISLGIRGVLELRAFRRDTMGGCVEVPLHLEGLA